MTWFKIDDKFPLHPKILEIGNAAVGLFVRCGAYSAAHLLDGFVPKSVVFQLGSAAERRALLRAGMLVEVEGGFQIHDYLEFNPTREKVLADKAAAAERQRKFREEKAASQRDTASTSRVTDAVTNGVSHGSPTRPDPTRPDPLLVLPLDDRQEEPAVDTPTKTRRAKAEREPNPMWDVLSECFVEPATKTERSNRGRIMRELTEAGATPDEVRKRVNEHARRRLHWDLTENALVTHWAELAPRRNDGDDISSVLGYRFTGSM